MLAPVCVSLGMVTATAAGYSIDALLFVLTLTGALLAAASVNLLNEYQDFNSGLDCRTDRTPFSGGSGALPAHPEAAGDVLTVALITITGTVLIGIYIVVVQGFQIVPIGAAGLLLIIAYTKWIIRSPLLCLISPGLGFGVLMVVGTHIALTGESSLLLWMVSIVPFCLINNLLLLNQYPDVSADSSVGRNHFPIAYGMGKSSWVYAIFMLSAYLMIGLLIAGEFLPGLSVIALAPVVFSVFSLTGAVRYSGNIGKYPRYLAANVAAAVLTPLLLAISISLG